jgi:hypothetical protein
MLGFRASLAGWVAVASLCAGCGGNDDDGASPGKGGAKADGGSSEKAGSTSKAGATSGGSPNTGEPTTTGDTFGAAHEGVYHLGPVDFEETEWHNACAPGGSKYRSELRETVGLSGEFLAGVANKYNDGGGVCDACILIETGMGKSIVARVVTYGVEQADGDIDVSPAVFEAIHQGEFPRHQTWRFARCPEAGKLQYEFQTEAHQYWSSLWVRNPRVPLTKLEVKSANHATFIEMARAPDGSLTDASGFGEGAFTFRLTAMDGQVLTDELPGFKPGELIQSTKQFE